VSETEDGNIKDINTYSLTEGLTASKYNKTIEIIFKNMPVLKEWHNAEILEYFNKSYKNNNFIKRALSDCYLFDKKYNEAYRAMFGIPQYSSEDYYKLGIAYLMSGFPEAADNFFTKSILKGIDIYNAYMAKAIMQAQKGDLKGILYYLKIMLKKDMSWLNTYIFLSFDLELK
jgi:tetratricopeptide (TPR) repeat protein